MKMNNKFSRSSLIMGSVMAATVASSSLQSLSAEATVPVAEEESSVSGKVQLGVTLAKPAEETYAQLPSLNHGCGFILKTIAPESSASKAGLKPMDVIWKIDDQLLINEGQLAVLLSLYKPGDEVKIDYFQSGKLQQVSMKLETASTKVAEANAHNAEFPFPFTPNLPMHVVSYEDKSATISDENGSATLKINDGKKWLVVHSTEGIEIYNAELSTEADLSDIPVVWRPKVPMLQRSLESSVSLRNLPRVRRVPTPKRDLVDRKKP